MERQIPGHEQVVLTRSKTLEKSHEQNEIQYRNFLINSKLSMDSAFLIAHLCALPKDIVVTIGDIKRRFKIGQKKITRIMAELIDEGYVARYRRRDRGAYTKSLTLYSYYPEYKNP
jgi:DNA-binding MarR family transcriptional regulator